MTKDLGPPTIAELIKAIEDVEIKFHEEVREASEPVRAVYVHDRDQIRISLSEHRKLGGADDMVMTLIHEAIHRVRPDWPERKVVRHEFRYFKSRALREHAALRLLDVFLSGGRAK